MLLVKCCALSLGKPTVGGLPGLKLWAPSVEFCLGSALATRHRNQQLLEHEWRQHHRSSTVSVDERTLCCQRNSSSHKPAFACLRQLSEVSSLCLQYFNEKKQRDTNIKQESMLVIICCRLCIDCSSKDLSLTNDQSSSQIYNTTSSQASTNTSSSSRCRLPQKPSKTDL